ncbi:hypothetical protein IQ07DRAFT_592978 [Pyrenochaeta sp. DS3sAY3a]|nr:hypothetical protein IQ07DRAFT_592978 [Pyrenochaeta sp. DS3sAY3a]
MFCFAFGNCSSPFLSSPPFPFLYPLPPFPPLPPIHFHPIPITLSRPARHVSYIGPQCTRTYP